MKNRAHGPFNITFSEQVLYVVKLRYFTHRRVVTVHVFEDDNVTANNPNFVVFFMYI